jgi:hypothetical protein
VVTFKVTKKQINWQERGMDSIFVDQNRACLYRRSGKFKLPLETAPKYLVAGNLSSGLNKPRWSGINYQLRLSRTVLLSHGLDESELSEIPTAVVLKFASVRRFGSDL